MTQQKIDDDRTPRVLPMRPALVKLVESGAKTATARTRKYGEVGDVLRVEPGAIMVWLASVDQRTLGTIATQHHEEEGMKTPEDFIAVWNQIHPRKPYDPGTLVWFHQFRIVADMEHDAKEAAARSNEE